MPDPNPVPPNAAPTETVPKAEFDRLATQAAENSKSLENLSKQLTDPDYLAYRESRVKANDAAARVPINLNTLTMEQLQGLIAQSVGASVKSVIQPLYERIDHVAAQQEVKDVMDKYEDFEEHRDEVAAVLKKPGMADITIEQAYLIVKGQAAAAPKVPDGQNNGQLPPRTPPKPNEKPSASVPVDGDTIKTFKSPAEAGAAAAKTVMAQHGLSGDYI